MNNTDLPQTVSEYMACFSQLAAIAGDAMDWIEAHPPVTRGSLDRISQNVETLASMRGDSGIYQNSRPEGLMVYQKEMYRIENSLRDRLVGLGYEYPAPRPLSETV